MIRVAAIAALLAGLLGAGGAWKFQAWRYSLQIADLTAKHQGEILAANERALQAERMTNQRLTEARNAAAKREQDLRRDGDALRDNFDRLRDQAAATRRDLSTATPDAARATAATATELLESCAREYQAVARAADGHSSDTLTLQQSWPK